MKEPKETDVHKLYREIFEEKSESFNYEKLRTKIEQIKEQERSKMDTLAYFLKSQLKNFETIPTQITANLQNIDKLQTQIVLLKTTARINRPTVGVDTVKLNNLLAVKKNISVVIERLGDFLNVTDKLGEMEQLIKDETNFPIIQVKLENILNLERMMLKEGGNKEDLKQFVRKFEEVHAFQGRFLAKINSVFDNYLRAARSSPETLKNAIDIVEMNDELNGDSQCKQEMLQRLKDAVFKRFEEKLGQKAEVHVVLENINFCVDDLLNIFELVAPIFPERYNIFEFFELHYKEQIQKRILPFLKDLSSLRENPGTLVYLFNWLASYEKLLAKVGFAMVDFNNLRDEIKKSMPIFFEHLTKLLEEFLQRISHSNYDSLNPEAEIAEMKTNMPDDIAIFMNNQIDLIAQQIRGEMLCNIFADWLSGISAFLSEHVS